MKEDYYIILYFVANYFALIAIIIVKKKHTRFWTGLETEI